MDASAEDKRERVRRREKVKGAMLKVEKKRVVDIFAVDGKYIYNNKSVRLVHVSHSDKNTCRIGVVGSGPSIFMLNLILLWIFVINELPSTLIL